jgi:hypothetical protein
MRKLMVCFTLLAMLAPAACANPGGVVYLYSAELAKSKDGSANDRVTRKADLMESDLTTGRKSVLVSGFYTGELDALNDASISVCRGGRYVAIGVRQTMDVSDGGITSKPNGLHLWDRTTRRTTVIYLDYNMEGLVWSESGRYLAILNPDSDGPLRVYDVSAGKMHVFPKYAGFADATWATKRDALIIAIPMAKKGSVILAQPMNGQSMKLFNWPRAVDSIAEFAGGSGYALCDSVGVWTYKPGGKAKRLPISRVQDDPWGVDFAPAHSGEGMAAMESYSFGEPHLNNQSTLYLFRLSDKVPRRIARWNSSLLSVQGEDGIAVEQIALAAWLSGDCAVVLYANVSWPLGDGIRQDWSRFYLFPVPNGQSGKLIFDSGPGCLSAVWWPGK